MSRPIPWTISFAMQPHLRPRLFDDAALRRLAALGSVHTEVIHDLTVPAAREQLRATDVLITGWGCPVLEPGVLSAGRLQAVVHAAGTVKNHLPDTFWDAGIAVSSAADANAVPVAEYTVAQILLANKQAGAMRAAYRRERAGADWSTRFPQAGNYRRTVGVVGASRIGRRVLSHLAAFDLDLLVSDPHVDDAAARALGARLVGLDELFRASDVVTLHAPDLPETRHLADARRLALMRPKAVLVNTARGGLVDTAALTDAVVSGRVRAVLDVTEPEILPPDSPLYYHPEVVLTPHIAGSVGGELRRLGDAAADEVESWVRTGTFRTPVHPENLAITA
ncbi:phosphoglycerate dehydrogenase-like enzyme [Promicromonospora sp. AC04]|uniref:hydroxyacid dehydrogenase n=1 Tax=Promicromonospora sp. AC04 TaxID=2135723 RepID=UPI000D3ADC34|nr:hydroxyacid dehydrogenase [Promicromonospora sp. AC04]PUB24948.1 phosphoglycerate dehydrogenase-like enzyme [Promicromonospora sp. AC04]